MKTESPFSTLSEHSGPDPNDKYVRSEQVILGNILLWNSKYEGRLIEQCQALRPDYFIVDFHRNVFRAMQKLYAKAVPIDEVSLIDTLGDQECHDNMWAFDAMTEGMVERKDLSYHINLIREGYRQRHAALVCDDIASQITRGETNNSEVASRLEATLERLTDSNDLEVSHHFGEIVSTVVAQKLALRDSGRGLVGYTTSLDEIDEATTGIRLGEYWVIGGAPSRGKTVFASQIVAANAENGIGCLVFSFEMSKEQFVERLIPYYSGVDARTVRDCRCATDEEMAAIEKAANRIGELPVIVVDADSLSPERITAISKLHIRNHGVKLIVVDYLQIIHGTGDTRREEVSSISNSLRSLAKQESVAVVGLSQLRRPTNEQDRPSMFELKESGDVEAHAHCILLLYRPKDESQKWIGDDEVIIAKQREGLVGTERVVLDQRKLRFIPR